MPAKSKAKDKSPFQQQCLDVLKDINEYRKGCEANVVSIMWKNPQLITECTLTLDDFLNNMWKVYWSILKEIIIDEGKTAIDDVVVGLHLEKHPALKEKYEEYGGYNTIIDAGQYVLEENFDAYVIELRKWQALMECAKKGWIDKARLSEYVDMTAEEIYEEFEVNINNIFLNTTTKIKSYDISDGIDELIDELDEGFAVGLPYMDLPMLSKETGGQYLGAITLVGGLSNVGKEQPISEPVLTKDGWKPMGEITIGTEVYGKDGKLHTVIGVFPQGVKDVYEVSFSDGTSTRCGLEHLWKVYTPKQRSKNIKDGKDRHKILKLSDMIKNYKTVYNNNDSITGKRSVTAHKYSVPLCNPIEFNNNQELPINPYLLGLLIGDGGMTGHCLSFTNSEDELFKQIEDILPLDDYSFNYKQFENYKQLIIKYKRNWNQNLLLDKLNILGLRGCDSRQKFIPNIYKWSSIENRAALLSGIINTDGSVDKLRTSITISTYSANLQNDIAEIARSLGYKVRTLSYDRTSETSTKKYDNEIEYLVRIMTEDWSLLSLSTKHKSKLRTDYKTQPKLITDIKKIGREESQCIMLDSEEHLYITKDYIVTHNTSLSRNATIGSFIKHKEPCVIMLNEEGIKKWQRETLVWVANNILKEDMQKHVVRDGKFSTDTKRILHEAADWIKEKTQNHILTIIPFEKYSTANVIKVIRKYSSMGVKYFVLDTFKLDAGKVNDNAWLEMQQHMVEINDVVKQEANNVHILVTFQLNKGSARQRFYTQDNIGMAKNIIDPASTCIMIRSMFDDEYPGCRNELHVYEIVGKNGKSRKQVKIDPNKRYQILFIVKNREGAANQYQIVIEHDLSRNILKEVGICNVPMD